MEKSLLGENLRQSITRFIRTKGEKYLALSDPLLTENEFIQAFINREHVPLLLQAQNLCGKLSTRDLHGIPLDDTPYRVNVRFEHDPPVPLPAYTEKGLSPDCPPPLRERLASWLPERVRQGDMLGDLIDAITTYDKNLPDLRSFAIMVPCLPMVAKKVSSGKKQEVLINRMMRGDKFSLPRLPEEVSKRIADASSFFMAISMIDDVKVNRNGVWIERASAYEYNLPRKSQVLAGVFSIASGASTI